MRKGIWDEKWGSVQNHLPGTCHAQQSHAHSCQEKGIGPAGHGIPSEACYLLLGLDALATSQLIGVGGWEVVSGGA